jgi:hypothetical protein
MDRLHRHCVIMHQPRFEALFWGHSGTLAQTRVTSLGVWSRGYVAVSTGLGHAQAFGNGVRRSQACVG